MYTHKIVPQRWLLDMSDPLQKRCSHADCVAKTRFTMYAKSIVTMCAPHLANR